jgi:hypothetical protein
MKKATKPFEPWVQTEVSDWMRWLWEVEAESSPMIGSRLKFAMPLMPTTGRKAARMPAKRRITAKA